MGKKSENREMRESKEEDTGAREWGCVAQDGIGRLEVFSMFVVCGNRRACITSVVRKTS